MKIKTFLAAITFLFLISSFSFCQDTVSSKYFPLKIGNSWTYYNTATVFPPPYYSRAKITKDTLMNGHRYFYMTGLYYNWIRYDSTNGNLLKYKPNNGCSGYQNDQIIDSLASSVNNIVHCLDTKKCTAVASQIVFGTNTAIKSFSFDGLTMGESKYAKNIGVIYSCGGEPPPCSGFSELKGCVINGIVYGDTTLTDISQINNIIPESFYLSQNYPNPFNPVTKIKFSIPRNSFVKLSVFDNLGRELEVIVKEQLQPGTYELEWNGEKRTSGIYYFKIETEEFTATRKMILLK